MRLLKPSFMLPLLDKMLTSCFPSSPHPLCVNVCNRVTTLKQSEGTAHTVLLAC